MIDFESAVEGYQFAINGEQKKIHFDNVLSVYFGLSQEGLYTLSFRSKEKPPKMESTKILKVLQVEECQNVWWTNFSLLDITAKKAFLSFCQSLLESVEGAFYEEQALKCLKKRFLIWKAMFKNCQKPGLSQEVIQGLFGELYFLKTYMLNKFDVATTIKSWAGPEKANKDFSLPGDWYEVKTIGTNAMEVVISSLAQLSSNIDGRLVILRVERMSDAYDDMDCNIKKLIEYIINIIDNEEIEQLFLNRLSEAGIVYSDVGICKNFEVKEISRYLVNDSFPRLTMEKLDVPEIANVKYTLVVNALEKYREA